MLKKNQLVKFQLVQVLVLRCATFTFGVKENNYLGKGINLDANLTFNEEFIKGNFSVTNPNYKNSDKSVFLEIFQAFETDRLTDFGYKTNKTGFSFGTNFEYLDDLNLGLVFNHHFMKKLETDNSISKTKKTRR